MSDDNLRREYLKESIEIFGFSGPVVDVKEWESFKQLTFQNSVQTFYEELADRFKVYANHGSVMLCFTVMKDEEVAEEEVEEDSSEVDVTEFIDV